MVVGVLSLAPCYSEKIRTAGTSPGVPGDILGSYEELRWMEPHMSSPSPCKRKIIRNEEVLHLFRCYRSSTVCRKNRGPSVLHCAFNLLLELSMLQSPEEPTQLPQFAGLKPYLICSFAGTWKLSPSASAVSQFMVVFNGENPEPDWITRISYPRKMEASPASSTYSEPTPGN